MDKSSRLSSSLTKENKRRHDPWRHGKAVQNPADVILFNIDSKASSANDGNKILNVFLSVFNEHLGFSANIPT